MTQPKEGRGGWRAGALDRFEQAVELPLLVLALALIPLLVIPLVVDVRGAARTAFVAMDWLIWAAFAVEYVVRLVLTQHRLRFVRREWPDLLLIVLPFLRPLRVARSARALRLLRLVRLAAVLAEASQEGRRLLVRHKLHYALLAIVVVVAGSSSLVYALEGDSGGPIDSPGDALWWSVTTVTTVGYGDTFPVTTAGRGLGGALMLTGIALFGVVTANLASYILERGRVGEQADDSLAARLDRIEEQLGVLTEAVARLGSSEAQPNGRDSEASASPRMPAR